MKAIDKRLEFYPKNHELINQISKELKISPILSQLLINRGITSPLEAYLFLNCKLENMYDPFLLKDMHKACERIKLAINRNEKIRIFGDYDVDGITATAVLFTTLKKLNANVSYFIPNRIEGGYGLNEIDIQNAKNDGVSLIISVDCGISNYAEIEFANKLGIETIITDHHEVPIKIPDAFAILNPKQNDCNYPFKMLAGVGVAYKFAQALEKYFKTDLNTNELLDLVALGTVADITPLIDENRIIAKFGIEMFNSTKNVGLLALLDSLNLRNTQINTTHISYILAPRINAAGRISDPNVAIKMFLTEDYNEAMHYVKILNEDNVKRQSLENEILTDVEEQLALGHHENIIMLASDKWHVGVIGIVASKIKEKYYKPTILISIENEENCIGSARSIASFSIVDALNECSDLLKRFGGHKLAAGFSIEFSKIDLFRKKLNQLAATQIKPDDLIPTLKIDSEIKLKQINENLVNEILMLKPFGQQNPKPLFYVQDAFITEHRKIGNNNNSHLLLKIKQGNTIIEGIGFNMGNYDEKIISPAQYVNLVFELDDFTFWEGQKKIQLKLKDLQFNKSSHFEFFSEENYESINIVKSSILRENIVKMFSLKNLGNEYFMKKNYNKAFEIYCKALELYAHPSLYYNIGLIYKCKGELEKAIENFKKVIELEKERLNNENSDLIKKSKVMIEKIYNLRD